MKSTKLTAIFIFFALLATSVMQAQPSIRSTNDLDIFPKNVTMRAGDSLVFTAVGRTHRGHSYTPDGLRWYATGGNIGQRGKYTAGHRQGYYTITVSLGSLRATARVEIKSSHQHKRISRIEVNPRNAQVRVGSSYHFSATGFDHRGNVVSFNPRWNISGGGYISNNGKFQAQYRGTYTVTASDRNSGVSGSARVVVGFDHGGGGHVHRLVITPRSIKLGTGQTYQFQVNAYDNFGRSVPCNPRWTAGGGNINSSGIYRAGFYPGYYQVRATVGNVSAISSVQVVRGGGGFPNPHPGGGNARITISKWDVGGGNFLRPKAKINLTVSGKRVQTVKLFSVSPNGRYNELQAFSCSNGSTHYFDVKYDRFNTQNLEVRVYNQRGEVVAKERRSAK